MAVAKYTRKGKIKRLYTFGDGCYIRLEGILSPPRSEYFKIDNDQENYNSLYSLALTAAVNRYEILIRTSNVITSTTYGYVSYMVVDWD